MYSRITSTSNGRDAIAYAEGTAHDGSDERNVLVTPKKNGIIVDRDEIDMLIKRVERASERLGGDFKCIQE